MKIIFSDMWDQKHNGQPNHQSSLTKDEMKELCGKVRSLLHTEFSMKKPKDDDGQLHFWRLYDALNSEVEVSVTKGIHQRESEEVHFKLRIADYKYEYHVYLKQGPEIAFHRKVKVPDPDGRQLFVTEEKPLFRFTPSGLSLVVNSVVYSYPPQFQKTTVRERGTSFSIGNSKGWEQKPKVGSSVSNTNVSNTNQ